MTTGIYIYAAGCLMGAFIATAVTYWWLRDKAIIPRELFLVGTKWDIGVTYGPPTPEENA